MESLSSPRGPGFGARSAWKRVEPARERFVEEARAGAVREVVQRLRSDAGGGEPGGGRPRRTGLYAAALAERKRLVEASP